MKIWEPGIEKENDKPKFQSIQCVLINAGIKSVWEFNQDISKIAEYHPRVNKVDLLDNVQYRAAGVSYQCHLIDGKNRCIEKDIEIVPYERIVTKLPFDTMGLTKILPDYIVVTNFKEIEANNTEITISHFYSGNRFFVKLINPFIKRKIAKETSKMLLAMKQKIEELK
jgi:hypothetical protein